jgi:hypothetical protein
MQTTPTKNINELIREHTAFQGALDLIKSARHPYRPSLACLSATHKKWQEELTVIAVFYDAAKQRLGIDKQAFRF